MEDCQSRRGPWGAGSGWRCAFCCVSAVAATWSHSWSWRQLLVTRAQKHVTCRSLCECGQDTMVASLWSLNMHISWQIEILLQTLGTSVSISSFWQMFSEKLLFNKLCKKQLCLLFNGEINCWMENLFASSRCFYPSSCWLQMLTLSDC